LITFLFIDYEKNKKASYLPHKKLYPHLRKYPVLFLNLS
jgi:hypothetical protein